MSAAEGQPLLFLGSSVTYGAAAGGYSFADALAEQDGLPILKEAVSGTTLVDDDDSSYIARLRRLPTTLCPRALICQLSTNDASRRKPLGEIAPSFDPGSFDTHTITGAIEAIIAHGRDVWHCPVMFYTGTRYDSDAYGQMVVRLNELAEKWRIPVLDLWNDADMLAVSAPDYARYMADPIHPTRAGYRHWWAPKFRAFLAACGLMTAG